MTEKLEKTTVSRDYVTNIITNMNDIMIVVSQDGAIQMANRACGDLLGYTEDELLGKPISLIFEERKGFARELKFDSLINRGAFRNVEKIAHSKTGEKIPILLSGAVMADDENRVQGVICVALDMRERLESEAALKKSYEELQLTQSQLIQSAKLASIGELASGVAHELNQPLMVIRGIFQLVRRSIGKNNLGISELLEQLEPIERNTKRMMNIINHLRTFSRQSGMEFGPVDGNKIIEDSLLMIREQLRIHDIQVKKDPDVDLPKIKGDANQLEQVFLNLITNARDAILQRSEVSGKKSENRGRLEIITRMGETDNHQSSINGQQSQNFAEILIRDNGSGIPADKVGKIFDPFFTTKEVGKGTGLGLSISYGIIKDHQGEISVAETSPRGTTFRVRLPIVD
jgi:PAS domain S-box-containing protein